MFYGSLWFNRIIKFVCEKGVVITALHNPEGSGDANEEKEILFWNK